MQAKLIRLTIWTTVFMTFLSSLALAFDPNKVEGSITFVTNRTDLVDSFYPKIAEQFKKKYPNVEEVEFEAIRDYDPDLRVRLSSKEYGDVLLVPNGVTRDQLPDFFAPLDALGFKGRVHFEDYRAFQGKMYGVVSGVTAEGLVYNKQAFAKAGISKMPTRLDDFYAAAQKLKDQGIVPLAINFSAQWPLQQWDKLAVTISGKGAYWNTLVNTDTPFNSASPYGKSFEILKTFIDKGYTEPDLMSTDWERSKVDVAQGKFGMYYLGNWVINQVIDSGGQAEDIGFAPIPTDNGKQVKALMNPDWFYAVNKHSENVDTAKAFVKFMVEESGFDDFSGFIPPLKEKQPALPQLKEFMGYNPQLVYIVPQSATFTKIANKAQIDIMSGGYIQRLMQSNNYDQAVAKLNQRWSKARKNVLGK